MTQEGPFVWTSHWTRLGWVVKLMGKVSGNHWGRAVALARQAETQIWHFPSISLVGRAQQGNNGLRQDFCVGESCSSSLSPEARQLSPSLNVPSTFQSAVPRLEVRASESQQVCVKPFRRKTWTSASLSLTQLQSSLVFHRVSFSVIDSPNLVELCFGFYSCIREVNDSFQLSTLNILWDLMKI